MIILVGNQKGGCGKSTLCTNLTSALAQAGRDVVLVDADEQATAATWAGERAQNEDLPAVHCIQKYGNIRDTLKDLSKRYEIVVVDAAGRDSRELRSGMTAADLLIVPFRPSQADLDTLYHTRDVIEQASDMNPNLKALGVITMAPTNPVINETREAREYMEDLPEITLLKTLVRDRKVYRDALSLGRGVIEMDNARAKGEISILLEEILSHG